MLKIRKSWIEVRVKRKKGGRLGMDKGALKEEPTEQSHIVKHLFVSQF